MHGFQREHSHRWPLPAAPAAPGHRLASASPRTAGRSRLSTAPGSAESGARRRDGRGLVGKSLNDSGQHADLGQHPVGAVQVPAEPEPLRRKGALRARRSPAQPPQPPGLPHSAAGPAPTMALPLDSRRLRLRDPEPIPGPCRAPGPAHRKPRPPKAPPSRKSPAHRKPRRVCALLCSPHSGPRCSRARRAEPPRGFSAPRFRLPGLHLVPLSLFRACAPPCLPAFIFSCSRWMLGSFSFSQPQLLQAACQGPHSTAVSVRTDIDAQRVKSEGSSSG